MDNFFEYIEDVSGITRFSNLLLLRRDIYTCFGINPNNRTELIGFKAIWPGTMTIMAGIDLLAKFHSGEDSVSNSSRRFKDFVSTYIDTDVDLSNEIYQLRNSMLHSFGLYGQDRKSNEFKFILSEDTSFFVRKTDEINSFYISVTSLHKKFESSIDKIKNALEKQDDKSNQIALLKKYGWTDINKTSC